MLTGLRSCGSPCKSCTVLILPVYSKTHNGTSLTTDYESIISDIFHSMDANHNKVSGFYVTNRLDRASVYAGKVNRCSSFIARHLARTSTVTGTDGIQKLIIVYIFHPSTYFVQNNASHFMVV